MHSCISMVHMNVGRWPQCFKWKVQMITFMWFSQRFPQRDNTTLKTDKPLFVYLQSRRYSSESHCFSFVVKMGVCAVTAEIKCSLVAGWIHAQLGREVIIKLSAMSVQWNSVVDKPVLAHSCLSVLPEIGTVYAFLKISLHLPPVDSLACAL